MSELWRDVRFGFRILFRRPGLTLPAVLSLILGIGTNTAMYSLFDAFILHPLPVEEPTRLVAVHQNIRAPGEAEFTGERTMAWENFQIYRQRSRGFEGMAVFQRGPMSLTGGDEPERIEGAFVSSSYFDVLGIPAEEGRLFLPEDDRTEGGKAVAVLSHGLWRRHFGADPGVVGKAIRINGRPFTVVGVAQQGFKGTEINTALDVWIPATMFPVVSSFASYFHMRDAGVFQCFGRLAPGVSVQAAEAELHNLSVALSSEYLANDEALGIFLEPLADNVMPRLFRQQLDGYSRTLVLAAIAILLIACLNVAALLWVRGLERQREIALRQALGAGTGRMVRQLILESLLLFFIGGALSLPVAYGTVRLLWSFRPPQFEPGAFQPGLDATTIAFALATAAASGLLFGLIPALRAARPDLTTCLQESGPAGSPGRSFFGLRVQLRSTMVALQVALALVGLLCAGLYLSSLRQVNEIDLGFEAEHLAVVGISPGEQGMDETQTRELYRRVRARLAALPGVRSVALSENRLLRGAIVRSQVYIGGQSQALVSPQGPDHRTNVVSPGFFATAGIPLVAGEDFGNSVTESSPPVVIINETMARTVWPGESAVGKTVHFNYPANPAVTVIGVAADIRYRHIMELPQFFLYVPLAQNHVEMMTVHVRTEGSPTSLLPAIRRALLELEPDLVLSDLAAMQTFVAEALWSQRIAVVVTGGFGALALILAMIGVFGVVSYAVAQKRHEIAVRRALGARPPKILRSLLGEIAAIVAAGIVIGWALGYSLVRPAIASQLYEVSAADPWIYGGQALLLAAVALVASLIPARRALSIDPMNALRGN